MDSLRSLAVEARDAEARVRAADAEVKAEQRRLKRNTTLAAVDDELRSLEQRRTTGRLSLTEEKTLLKHMQQLRADRVCLEKIEELKERRRQLATERDMIALRLQGDAPNRVPGTALTQISLCERISRAKGGAIVLPDLLTARSFQIPTDRIGQFLGKSGAASKQFEAKFNVAANIENDGTLTVVGIAEDVAAAAHSVDQFLSEVSEELVLNAFQASLLRHNKGERLSAVESVLGVRVRLSNQAAASVTKQHKQQPRQGDVVVLTIRGEAGAVAAAKNALTETIAGSGSVKLIPGGYAMRHLLANSGAEIQSLEQTFNVSLDIEREKGRVVVTGPEGRVEAACSALRSLCLEHEHETLTITLPNVDMVPALIGKKGATIRSITEETGVEIDVRRAGDKDKDKDSKESVSAEATVDEPVAGTAFIVLSAPRHKLPFGKSAVEAVISQYERENATVLIPRSLVPALLAPSGKVTLAELQKDFNVTLSLRRKDTTESGDVPLAIRGEEDHVSAVKAQLESRIASQSSQTVPVPAQARAALIGTKGETISRIQQESGAQITLGESDATLDGTPEQLEAAKAAIDAELARFEREHCVLHVLASSVGSLVGKKGGGLKKIIEDSGAQVDVAPLKKPTENDESGDDSSRPSEDDFGTIKRVVMVRIRGPEESIEQAKKAISAAVGHAVLAPGQANPFRMRAIPVPSPEATRNVVGRGGETIKAIEARFEVKVDVTKAKVVIHGQATADFLLAIDHVKQLLADGVSTKEKVTGCKKRLLHFLSDAANVRRLCDETGSSLQVDESGDVLLEGPTASLKLIREALHDIEQGAEREILRFNPKHYEGLVNQESSALETLRREHHVKLGFDPVRHFIRVVGKAKYIGPAKAAINVLLRTKFPDQVVHVPLASSAVIPLVIGKQGKIIRKLQNTHKVSIDIHRSPLGCDVVGINPAGVAAAAKEIEQLSQNWDRENIEVPVPAALIPVIIGRKGANIKRLKEESGVKSLDVDRESESIRVNGEPQALEKARALIKDFVVTYERENDTMTIDPEHVRVVIGHGGATVSAIQELSGATVRVERNSNTLHIKGDESAIVKARAEIARVLDEHRQKSASSSQPTQSNTGSASAASAFQPVFVGVDDTEHHGNATMSFPLGEPVELDTAQLRFERTSWQKTSHAASKPAPQQDEEFVVMAPRVPDSPEVNHSKSLHVDLVENLPQDIEMAEDSSPWELKTVPVPKPVAKEAPRKSGTDVLSMLLGTGFEPAQCLEPGSIDQHRTVSVPAPEVPVVANSFMTEPPARKPAIPATGSGTSTSSSTDSYYQSDAGYTIRLF